jgi:hypothetical protein
VSFGTATVGAAFLVLVNTIGEGMSGLKAPDGAAARHAARRSVGDALGGERAYSGRLEKDRTPGQRCRSIVTGLHRQKPTSMGDALMARDL